MNKQAFTPTMLVILDGFGYNSSEVGNAVAHANMPNWKKWLKIYPNTLLKASGEAVGLLPGYIGNSEVGHTCMGSGRIVETAFKKFHDTIKDKSFFKNELLINHFKKLKENNKTLHLMGLLSDAGVHAHEEHFFATLELAKQVGVEKILIHAFLDGRDTPPKSAGVYLQKLQDFCKKLNCGQLASMHGRFYAMDRDNNWDRTQVSYDVLCEKTLRQAQDERVKQSVRPEPVEGWQEALKDSYANNITDEFFKPLMLVKDGNIKEGDGIFFLNFRPDRARQLTESFIDPNFNHFPTKPLNSTTGTLEFFITTTRYKGDFKKFNNDVLFEKETIKHTLLQEISDQTHKNVFVIAETEKYAHVTYFFHGMEEQKPENETRVLIPSIKAKNYIDIPQMSAQKITEAVLKSLQTDPAYFYLINYANPDMVGHSGNFDATVKACEFLDKQLEELYSEVVEKQNGTLFITSDHGNAEEMIDNKTGKPKTAHTNNPVFFMEINKKLEFKEKEPVYSKPVSELCNIAPTILKFLGLKIPKDMSQKAIF